MKRNCANRIISALLAVLMCLCCMQFVGAEEADGQNAATEDEENAKGEIDEDGTEVELMSGVYGEETTYSVTIGGIKIPFSDYPQGSYYTDDGKACQHTGNCSYNSESGCNCKLYWNGVNMKAIQCHGFARMVFYRLFNVIAYGSNTTSVVSNVKPVNITESYLKSLFTDGSVLPGAFITVAKKDDNHDRHCFIFMGYDNDYFYSYEGNYDNHCKVGILRRTWSELTQYVTKEKNGIESVLMPLVYPGFSAPTVSVPSGTYSIRTLCNTSKALDVDPSVADTFIWDTNSNDTQKWIIEPVSGYYKIINAQTGLALDVKGGTAASGTQVQQYKYNGSAAQMWQFLDAGNGNYYIRSALGFYLDLDGAITTNGNKIYVYNLNGEGGRTNQTWKLVSVPGTSYSSIATGDYTIVCGSNYLTAAYDSNLGKITGTASTGNVNQQYTIKPCGSSYYIESKASSSGRVVNVNTTTHSANGNGVTLYQKTADGSQTWLFEKKNNKYIIHPTDNKTLALTLNSNGSVSVNTSTGASNQLWSVTNLVMCTTYFDANGGTGAPNPITAPIGSTITIPSQIPERYGYDFLGWWIQGTEGLWHAGTTYQAVGETFLAYWAEKAKYYVNFNANGGNGGPNYQSKYAGETITITGEQPTRTGYTFLGWSASQNGGIDYYSGSPYVNDSSVTLYAVWERTTPGQPTISVASTEITEADSLQVYWNNVANCNYFELHVFKQNSDERVFVDWNTPGTSYSVRLPAGSYRVAVAAINSEVEGNSSWTYSDWINFTVSEKYYTISYNANGGENAPAAQTKRHGQSITITTDVPTRAGYTFKGWAGTLESGVELVPGQVCDYNYSWTFFAVWESTIPDKPVVNTESKVAPENIPFTIFWSPVKNVDYYEVWLCDGTGSRIRNLCWDVGNTYYTTCFPAGEYTFEVVAINQERVNLGIEYANSGYTSVTVKPIDDFVPSETVKIKGHTYWIFEDYLSWETARQFCESIGGHLATITSEEEQNAIASTNIFVNTSQIGFWLGASDAEEEGIWKWLTGEPFSYSNWHPDGQPDNANLPHPWIDGVTIDEDYLMIYSAESTDFVTTVPTAYWNDSRSNSSNRNIGFICEFEPLRADANSDGALDAEDLRAYLRALCGAASLDTTLCDIDGDGRVGLSDLRELAKMLED